MIVADRNRPLLLLADPLDQGQAQAQAVLAARFPAIEWLEDGILVGLGNPRACITDRKACGPCDQGNPSLDSMVNRIAHQVIDDGAQHGHRKQLGLLTI